MSDDELSDVIDRQRGYAVGGILVGIFLVVLGLDGGGLYSIAGSILVFAFLYYLSNRRPISEQYGRPRTSTKESGVDESSE